MSKKKTEEITNVVEIQDYRPLKSNEINIPTIGIINLKPTKLKYFKSNAYNNFLIIKNMGLHELLKYQDGEDVLKEYLCAVFDVEKDSITYIDEMSTEDIYSLIEKMNKINNVKEEDFLAQSPSQEVMPD